MTKGARERRFKHRGIENHHGARDRRHAAGQHNKKLSPAKPRQHGTDRQGRFHHPHKNGHRRAKAHGTPDLQGFA